MYKTLRSLKVERNGKLVKLPPGADIPEAATFRNLKSWINRGWITDQDGTTPPEHRSLVAKVLGDVPKKAAPKPVPPPEPPDETVDLSAMSKRELNTFAKEAGLNPRDYDSRGDLENALMELDE